MKRSTLLPLISWILLGSLAMANVPATAAPTHTDPQTSVSQVKAYAELSVAEKKALHANYESIQPGDEPPYPLYGMKDINARIQLLSIQEDELGQSKDGQIIATVQVDSKGMPLAVSIYKAPDIPVSNFVVGLLMKTRFKPAKCSGKPCQMDFYYETQLPKTSK
ncbi:hypothetical protein [Chitinimonas sp. JJ19]|uniref:hypothetical protein n=1 Tax=Chitinimonas sp. JJ19 TaxID=3109352 RepID=UPI002FFFF93C